MMRRWRNFTVVRRRRPDPPWTVTAPPPGFMGGNPRWAPVARRGKFTVAPLAALVVAGRWPRRPMVMLLARRGEFFPVPFPLVVPAGPAPLVPSMRRAPHSYSLLTRPRLFTEPPWPQIAAASPPPLAPMFIRTTARPVPYRRPGEYQQLPPPVQGVPRGARRRIPFLPARRGEFVPFPSATSTPPAWDVRRPPRAMSARRGEFLLFTPPAAVPPPTPRRTPRLALAVRRGRFIQLVSPVVTPVAPGVPPKLASRRRQLAAARHGRFQSMALVGAPVGPVLRDITVTFGPLTTGWVTGDVATGWSTGTPTTGWTIGQLEV